MPNSAPATLSFGGNPAAGIAPSTYNTSTGQQVATSPTAGQFNSPSSNNSGVNQTALAQGVKNGTVTGTLDAQGNYVPPSATAADLHAQGVVSGQTPTVPNATANGTASSATPAGLQMPTGATASTQFDPATGQQENPSKAAFDQMKASGTPPPQDSSSGVSGANTATTAATPPPAPSVPPAVTSFLQSDTVQQQAAALMQQFAPASTTAELTNQIAQVNTDKTILAGLNTQLMNIKNVMAGTQNDIRSEINAAGGFSTESQVDALTVARNKTLQTQATQLTDQIATQNQMVANDTSLLTDEKDMAATQFNEQSSVYKMAQDNYNSSLNAAKESLNAIKDVAGYSGLYQSLLATGGEQAVNHAEQVLGFQPGQLQQIGIAQTAAMGTADIKTLMANYADAGIQPTDSLTQAQAKVLQSPTYKLKIAADKANINQSNASAGASEASANKTNEEAAFEKANGGLSQAEVTANQKTESDQVQKFQLNAATLIGNMVNKSVDWNTAWNQLHSEFPQASAETIDNALNATQYRSKYGG